jgi:hypothetical protein
MPSGEWKTRDKSSIPYNFSDLRVPFKYTFRMTDPKLNPRKIDRLYKVAHGQFMCASLVLKAVPLHN